MWLRLKDQNDAVAGVLYLQGMERYSATKEIFPPFLLFLGSKKTTGCLEM